MRAGHFVCSVSDVTSMDSPAAFGTSMWFFLMLV